MLKWTVPTQMPQATEDGELWMPQSPMRNHYQNTLPPNVVIQYHDQEDFSWNTMPKNMQKKTPKKMSSSSTDSGVSVRSSHTERIQLTKTVKESLIISENSDLRSPSHTASVTRKPSMSPKRPHSHPTYRMPPLTPTVATLINTATVPVRKQKKRKSPPIPGTKPVKPVTSRTSGSENPYLVPNGPDSYNRVRSHTARENKYDTLQTKRGNTLKEIRMLNTQDQAEAGVQTRHSWNGEQEECSTNFGRGSVIAPPDSTLPPVPISNGIQTSMEVIPSSSSKIALASNDVNNAMKSAKSKTQDAMPPPPPRRAPTTKLTHSFDRTQPPPPPRKSSLTNIGSSVQQENPRANMQRHMSLPLIEKEDGKPSRVSAPSPLASQSTSRFSTHSGDHEASSYPNSIDLPAPPPPDVLYDTMKDIKSLQNESNTLNLPPPPPTL